MPRYDQMRYFTTHNSYSGGGRGSIPAQLSAKIRYVEFDIHDNGWSNGVTDFQIGHLKPGAEVSNGNGNPTSFVLKDWLQSIASWSIANPGHGPVGIVFDAKDDLTDNDSGGDLEDLNAIISAMFGPKLFTRDEFDRLGAWPDVAAMTDRILCVISGSGSTRAAYRWAFGTSPSIAVNASGHVVLAYMSPIGDVRIWTGAANEIAQSIAWRRKLNYRAETPPISEPAIALTDDGWVTLVYRFPMPPFPDQIASHVGKLGDDGRIAWLGRAQAFAAGSSPGIQIDGDNIIEVHTGLDGKRQEVAGKLNRTTRAISWKKPKTTQKRRIAINLASYTGADLGCLSTLPDGWIGYTFDGGIAQPVRFSQLAFVEWQAGEPRETFIDPLFFAAPATNPGAIKTARGTGLVSRAWGFENGNQTTPPNQENMPATNNPMDAWYQTYMQGPDVSF